MSDDRLSRRKVLGGLVTIGAAGAVAGAGTMAGWSDTETSSDNTVTAGSLDLEPAGSSDGGSFDVSADQLAPGDVVEVGYLDLKNEGTVDGELDYRITGIQDDENGRVDPETDSGDGSGGNPGAGNGELSNVLLVRAFVDESPGNGTRNEDTSLTGGFVGLSGGRVDTNIPVTAGEEIRIWVDAKIDDSANQDALDRAMTDSCLVDVEFYLDQV